MDVPVSSMMRRRTSDQIDQNGDKNRDDDERPTLKWRG
jgi:hypothetical protein